MWVYEKRLQYPVNITQTNAECVINIIFIKTRSFNFFYRKIFCQLIDNRADDFDMGKFLCSNIINSPFVMPSGIV